MKLTILILALAVLTLSACQTSYQHPPCPPEVDAAIQDLMR